MTLSLYVQDLLSMEKFMGGPPNPVAVGRNIEVCPVCVEHAQVDVLLDNVSVKGSPLSA